MTDNFFDLRLDEDGYLYDNSGCAWRSKRNAMYVGHLGLCPCGHPEEVHLFLTECLKKFDEEAVGYEKRSGVSGVVELVKNNPEAAAEFISNFLDSKGLTEHGGTIYGAWITDLGREFIEIGPMTDED